MGIVKEGMLDGLQLPPKYSVSEWANMHVMLPAEGAAEPGRWRTDRAPYQRQMMDVFADPAVKMVVMETSAQVGKTSVLLNVAGYYIHHAPSPMMIIEPTLEMAEAFSKDKLDPMIRDTPVLFDRVAGEKSRSAGNTMRHKTFPGGFLAIAGANSPAGLRMRSVKVILADEVDEYPAVVGDQGDPVKLAEKRTTTFHDAKMGAASTPTVKDLSRIDTLFAKSDQRHYHVPCPECGHEQHMVWENVIMIPKQPEKARYACSDCGALWTDAEIKAAVRKGHWVAHAEFKGVAGFHIWQIYSPWSSLQKIVAEYEDAQGKPAEMQVFWNTTLGRVWDGDQGLAVTADELFARREKYAPTRLPDRVAVVTAGVDVQGDRLEVLIKGYGPDNEQWCIDMLKIYGNPSTDAPWAELAEVLQVRIPHPSGRAMPVEAVAIDSGYLTQKVYDFSARHLLVGRRWYAIKGVDGPGRVAWLRSDVRLKNGARLYLVGVDGLKTELYSRLSNEKVGANYVHFPDNERFSLDWFAQLTVEKVRVVYDARGHGKQEWHKPDGARNEALDLNVYADAAHKSLNINHVDRLAHMYQRVKAPDAAAIAAAFM